MPDIGDRCPISAIGIASCIGEVLVTRRQMSTELTSRQRVQCVLNGETPDRVPFNFWMDRDKMAEYDRKWGADFRITHYGADVVEAFIGLPWWAELPMQTLDDGKTVWQTAPLVESIKDALVLQMPDPANPEVYSSIEAARRSYPDKAIFAMLAAPLNNLEPLRMIENLYLDIYDHTDVIRELLDRMKPIMIESAKRACAMDIDVLYLAGDICSRDGAMVSPRHLRDLHFEYMKEIIDIAHEAGKKVFYHSDGLLMPVLDLYMEYGIDGCNPLEPRYNDHQEFLHRTGGRMMLYGGLDNCSIIPDGSVDDIRAHVRSQFETFGTTSGLIFSSHDIPGHCPQENLDAMVGEIRSCIY